MKRRPGSKPVQRSLCLLGEMLELRQMLDASGAIWDTDVSSYTISFADDGTDVGPKDNSIHAELAHLGEPEVWQEAIVRGFQTWAKHTDVDLIVVEDDGTAFGVPGNANRDPRFGDIRVAAIPFDSNLVAHSIPTDEPDSRTWSGDFILNSNAHVRSLDDLFIIAVHEAGHVFGLEHSDDVNSPLYGLSAPTSTTPTADDLAALDSIYGGRAPDYFDNVRLQGSEKPEDGPVNPEIDNPDLENPDLENPDLEPPEIENAEDENPENDEMMDQEPGEEAVLLQLDPSESNIPTLIFGDIQSAEDIDAYQASEIADVKQLVSVTLLTEGISQLQATLQITNAEDEILASVPFSDRTDAGQVFQISDLGSVDHRNLVFEVVSNAEAAPYDAGGYTLVLQQADIGDELPEEVPELGLCVNTLAHSRERNHTPNSLQEYLGTCQRLDNGMGGVPQFILDALNGNTGNPIIGVDPVDPTESPFCGFDWLDDLFSCIAWGDLNGDGQVTFADFLKLSVNFGSQDAEPEDGDIDDDGVIGFSDFLILSRNFGVPITFGGSGDAVESFP